VTVRFQSSRGASSCRATERITTMRAWNALVNDRRVVGWVACFGVERLPIETCKTLAIGQIFDTHAGHCPGRANGCCVCHRARARNGDSTWQTQHPWPPPGERAAPRGSGRRSGPTEPQQRRNPRKLRGFRVGAAYQNRTGDLFITSECTGCVISCHGLSIRLVSVHFCDGA